MVQELDIYSLCQRVQPAQVWDTANLKKLVHSYSRIDDANEARAQMICHSIILQFIRLTKLLYTHFLTEIQEQGKTEQVYNQKLQQLHIVTEIVKDVGPVMEVVEKIIHEIFKEV